MTSSFDIYLASASPRRRELLEQIGVSYQLLSVEVDEALQANESPESYVSRLALEKARAGWQLLENKDKKPVLGADTSVVINSRILGKPVDKDHAVEMLTSLSGQTHQVISGIALVSENNEKVLVNTSSVTFRDLSKAEIEAYWHTGNQQIKQVHTLFREGLLCL